MWVSASALVSTQHRNRASSWISPGVTQTAALAWFSEPPRDSELPNHFSHSLSALLESAG